MGAPDVWDSAAFSSIFLASGFSCSQTESTPTHTQVTQIVSQTVGFSATRDHLPTRAVRESMTRWELLTFMRAHRMVVQTSVSTTNAPQAAVVGAVVTDRFEIFFDTLDSTRKVRNLRNNSRIAFVLGGLVDGEERTVQYEGVADEPCGPDWCTCGRGRLGFGTPTSTRFRRWCWNCRLTNLRDSRDSSVRSDCRVRCVLANIRMQSDVATAPPNTSMQATGLQPCG